MKKLVAFALVMVLALSLAACGGGGSSGGGAGSTAAPPDTSSTPAPAAPSNAPDDEQGNNGGSEEAVDIIALVGTTIDNERLVLVSNDNEDHIYGEASHYLFLTFDEEDKIDQFGDSGSYYVFADEASFDAGLEEMGSNKGSNRTSLFIQGYTVFPNDWPSLTFAEIVERIETDSGMDNYSAYYDIVR